MVKVRWYNTVSYLRLMSSCEFLDLSRYIHYCLNESINILSMDLCISVIFIIIKVVRLSGNFAAY